MSHRRKHLDFEINLIPCIDLLSVCICFLLLTAVWLHVGIMNVKQAVGGQAAGETAKKPVVWVNLQGNGDLVLDVQETGRVPANLRKAKVAGREGHPDYSALAHLVGQLRVVEPELNTALIQPHSQTAYEDIIAIMDEFKRVGMIDLGVAPL